MKKALFLLVGLFVIGCTRTTVITPGYPHPQVFGEYSFYNETPNTITFPSANTYVNLTSTNVCLGSNGMCDTYALNIMQTGYYNVEWHISFGGGPTVEYHGTIGVNGLEREECHGARVIGTGGDVGNFGGTCILYLSYGDRLTLMVENKDNTQSINVQDANFNAVLI